MYYVMKECIGLNVDFYYFIVVDYVDCLEFVVGM